MDVAPRMFATYHWCVAVSHLRHEPCWWVHCMYDWNAWVQTCCRSSRWLSWNLPQITMSTLSEHLRVRVLLCVSMAALGWDLKFLRPTPTTVIDTLPVFKLISLLPSTYVCTKYTTFKVCAKSQLAPWFKPETSNTAFALQAQKRPQINRCFAKLRPPDERTVAEERKGNQKTRR